MTNKSKLAFDLLEQELEVFSREEQRGVLGGSSSSGGFGLTYEQLISAVHNGNFSQLNAGRYTMDADVDLTIFLNEVIVTRKRWASSNGYSSGYSSDYFWDWTNTMTGGSGSVWLNSDCFGGGGGSTGGAGSAGGSGTSTLLDTKFYSLLDATGKTASSFSGMMDTAHDISKLGEFATEAKALLKNFTKYSGVVGTTLDIVLSGIEIYADGQMTKDELVTFLTNQVTGGIIGNIPIAGGVLSIIYDASGADDLLPEQIVILVNKYY